VQEQFATILFTELVGLASQFDRRGDETAVFHGNRTGTSVAI
jgi:hypothetical protein